ncbi:MAG TPA: hypothetical protein VIL74_00235 [Pyrinomonadaceae bacterium]|jgi:hypothetical protein
MKKIIEVAVLSAFIICAFLSVSAQNREIAKSEYAAVEKNANAQLKGKSYRVKMISEIYRDPRSSKPSWTSATTSEYASENYRSVSENRTEKGVERREMIGFGGRRFTKTNDEPWKELAANEGVGGGSGALVSDPIETEKKIEYKYLGKQSVENQSVDLYESREKLEIKIGNSATKVVLTERLWIKDGLFLKTEMQSENDGRIVSRYVREYEYDPNIKIEPPLK